jgi:hypothetical protein
LPADKAYSMIERRYAGRSNSPLAISGFRMTQRHVAAPRIREIGIHLGTECPLNEGHASLQGGAHCRA